MLDPNANRIPPRSPGPARSHERDAQVWFEAGRLPAFPPLYAAFRATLSDEQGATLKELLDLAEEQANDWHHGHFWDTIDGVARHLPGVGPAIRALAQHVIDDSGATAGSPRCGITWNERIPSVWTGCAGPVATGVNGEASPSGPDAA